MSKFLQGVIVFVIGGLSYAMIELIWRGRTHWSMMLAGGICMLLLFEIFSIYRDLSLFRCALVGAFVITAVEFAFGYIFNYWLKMNIWDYSNRRFNFMGQICPMYTFLWGLLSIPVSRLCIQLKMLFERINNNRDGNIIRTINEQ